MSPFQARTTHLLAAIGFVALPLGLQAQINSSASSVAMSATLSETLTISVSPSTVSFVLVPNGGVSSGNNGIQIVTTWVLAQGRANVVLDGYFASSTAALSYAGTTTVNIPSSDVLGQMTTGTPTSYTAFTQSAALGPSGAGLTLFTQAITTSNRESNRTDTLTLQINTTSLPQLPAATYTGTMMLQAQAL